MKIEPAPESWRHGESDDLGLLYGCRGCNKPADYAVVPEEARSVMIPWCGDAECRAQVDEVARETAASERSERAAPKKKLRWQRRVRHHFLKFAISMIREERSETETLRARFQ